MESMIVKSPWRIFPRVLHINPILIPAFNFNALDVEDKVSHWH